jgi:hypothetical protein
MWVSKLRVNAATKSEDKSIKFHWVATSFTKYGSKIESVTLTGDPLNLLCAVRGLHACFSEMKNPPEIVGGGGGLKTFASAHLVYAEPVFG